MLTAEAIFLSDTSLPALGPTQLSIQWVQSLFAGKESGGGRETGHASKLTSGVLPPLPHTPSWRAKWQLYISCEAKLICLVMAVHNSRNHTSITPSHFLNTVFSLFEWLTGVTLSLITRRVTQRCWATGDFNIYRKCKGVSIAKKGLLCKNIATKLYYPPY